MALPATFRHDPNGAGTWCSNSGIRRRYDYVAISRSQLPSVAAAGVDPRIHVASNLRVDHLRIQVAIHAPTVGTASASSARAGASASVSI